MPEGFGGKGYDAMIVRGKQVYRILISTTMSLGVQLKAFR